MKLFCNLDKKTIVITESQRKKIQEMIAYHGSKMNFDEFNLAIPKALEGVETKLLNPINTWANASEYKEARSKLAKMFVENFKRYGAEGEQIAAAGPRS